MTAAILVDPVRLSSAAPGTEPRVRVVMMSIEVVIGLFVDLIFDTVAESAMVLL